MASSTLTRGASKVSAVNVSAAQNAPTAAPTAPVIHPVIAAFNALRTLGLSKSSDGKRWRATGAVAVASIARKECSATERAELSGRFATALENIGTIERNANDCLPVAIGGPNPSHVRIGEVFASVLGFSADARKARNAEIALYVENMK